MVAKLLTSDTGESYARSSVGTVTPALCGVHNDDIVPFGHDLAKAKAMFAEAGWTDSNADGILDKDGKKFQFTLATNTGNKRRADIQVLVQAQLQAVGVIADLEKAETNAFYENMRNKDFEAAIGGWSAALYVDPSEVWHCDTEDRAYPFNFTGYCNPEVDALIDQGLRTPNPLDAAPMWKDLQAKVYEDQPYLFLWWMDEIVGIHERFDDTSIDILSSFNRLHEWNVPEDKVKYKR
jgi:peptide/nickel transport system substrate-binding protein